MNSLIITTLVLISAGLAAGSVLFWTVRLGIGPTPTSRKVRSTLRKILPDTVSGNVIELGCGWGHLIPLLKEKYPDNKIQAWERSSLPALITRGIYGIEVKRENFLEADLRADLGKAGLVVCYLFPGAMQQLEKTVIPNLPTDCWLVTHTFRLPERVPVAEEKADDLYQTPIYLYRIDQARLSAGMCSVLSCQR